MEPKGPIWIVRAGERAAFVEEFLEKGIVRIGWEKVGPVVAILRAMKYRTRVSAEGSDRGMDIFASPDGLGLQEPRVFVEVKHRRNEQIGAPDIRAFLGGRKPTDRCLLVSTGGFSKEARYEAERSAIALYPTEPRGRARCAHRALRRRRCRHTRPGSLAAGLLASGLTSNASSRRVS